MAKTKTSNPLTGARKLMQKHAAERKRRGEFTPNDAKKMLAGAMKLVERQTKAYERLAKGVEALDLGRGGPPKEILALVKRATPLLAKLLASSERGTVDLDEMSAERERQKVIAAKRNALVREAWERTDKRHHGADCEWDACVCALYLVDRCGGRALHVPGAETVAAYGQPLPQEDGGESTGVPDFEVKS